MIWSCFGYFHPGNAAVVLFQFGTRVGLGNMIRSAPAGQTEPVLRKRIPSDFLVFHRSRKGASAGCFFKLELQKPATNPVQVWILVERRCILRRISFTPSFLSINDNMREASLLLDFVFAPNSVLAALRSRM